MNWPTLHIAASIALLSKYKIIHTKIHTMVCSGFCSPETIDRTDFSINDFISQNFAIFPMENTVLAFLQY